MKNIAFFKKKKKEEKRRAKSIFPCFNRKVYKGKYLAVGGSAKINYLDSNSYFGDLSAIVIKNLPWWAEKTRIPKKKIALILAKQILVLLRFS
jgi:hypothetical protein